MNTNHKHSDTIQSHMRDSPTATAASTPQPDTAEGDVVTLFTLPPSCAVYEAMLPFHYLALNPKGDEGVREGEVDGEVVVENMLLKEKIRLLSSYFPWADQDISALFESDDEDEVVERGVKQLRPSSGRTIKPPTFDIETIAKPRPKKGTGGSARKKPKLSDEGQIAASAATAAVEGDVLNDSMAVESTDSMDQATDTLPADTTTATPSAPTTTAPTTSAAVTKKGKRKLAETDGSTTVSGQPATKSKPAKSKKAKTTSTTTAPTPTTPVITSSEEDVTTEAAAAEASTTATSIPPSPVAAGTASLTATGKVRKTKKVKPALTSTTTAPDGGGVIGEEEGPVQINYLTTLKRQTLTSLQAFSQSPVAFTASSTRFCHLLIDILSFWHQLLQLLRYRIREARRWDRQARRLINATTDLSTTICSWPQLFLKSPSIQQGAVAEGVSNSLANKLVLARRVFGELAGWMDRGSQRGIHTQVRLVLGHCTLLYKYTLYYINIHVNPSYTCMC